MDIQFGASELEWDHFSNTLNLTENLLPVVCDPSVKIDPSSQIKTVGKVPSLYTRAGRLVGIAKWTSKNTTTQEVESWRTNPHLGIFINCRGVKALDVDVDDAQQADAIRDFLMKRLGPCYRYRDTSPRTLFPFKISGGFAYKIARCVTNAQGHKVEFLADGQGFQACGTHVKSLSPYRWRPELPVIPTITEEDLFALWDELCSRFGYGTVASLSRKREATEATGSLGPDPVAEFVEKSPFFIAKDRDGNLQIRCPWQDEHTMDSGPTETIYMPPSNGYGMGHFKCLHGHCAERTDEDFLNAISFNPFETTLPSAAEDPPPKTGFFLQDVSTFRSSRKIAWHVKGIVPRSDLLVMYGQPGSGKSFVALDMAMAIAKGTPWVERKVTQGRVVYVCAEGASGFAQRISAYEMQHNLPSLDMFYVVDGTPNLLDKGSASMLYNACVEADPDLIIIDTFAQTTPGGNENSSEDVGKALGHCRELSRKLGCSVMLIHHAGKDDTRGARGWSGLLGATDCEILIRHDKGRHIRSMHVTKLKDGEEDLDGRIFSLPPVLLGEDEDGDPITSCVVSFDPPDSKLPTIELPTKGTQVKRKQEDMIHDLIMAMMVTKGNGSFYSTRALTKACLDELPPLDRADEVSKIKLIKKVLSQMQSMGEIVVLKTGKIQLPK